MEIPIEQLRAMVALLPNDVRIKHVDPHWVAWSGADLWAVPIARTLFPEYRYATEREALEVALGTIRGTHKWE